MDSEITFTPAQLAAMVLAISAAIVTISAAISIIAKWITKLKTPEIEQNTRLDVIDKRLDEVDKTLAQFREYFTNDDNRFKAIEKSNKITQGALLALMKHALNGNETTSLKEAEKALEEYLIEK